MRKGSEKKMPRAGTPNGIKGSRISCDPKSIPEDNFERGTRWAGIALVLMFGFMLLGVILWDW